MNERGRWDWLCDLVARAPAGGRAPAICDAICRLGLRPVEIIEGVAATLGISAASARSPAGTTAASADGERLARLLPALAEHDHPAVRELAEHWLSAPAVAYQIPIATLEAWLHGDGLCADVLAPRIHEEGLALLPPAALRRLARSATRATVRAGAQRWLERL